MVVNAIAISRRKHKLTGSVAYTGVRGGRQAGARHHLDLAADRERQSGQDQGKPRRNLRVLGAKLHKRTHFFEYLGGGDQDLEGDINYLNTVFRP